MPGDSFFNRQIAKIIIYKELAKMVSITNSILKNIKESHFEPEIKKSMLEFYKEIKKHYINVKTDELIAPKSEKNEDSIQTLERMYADQKLAKNGIIELLGKLNLENGLERTGLVEFIAPLHMQLYIQFTPLDKAMQAACPKKMKAQLLQVEAEEQEDIREKRGEPPSL